MTPPIRFGFQLSGEHAADPITSARRAEELGFDVVLTSDHVGPGLSPMITLAAIASATSRIRLGTFVLNNDMRNPVQLAWEAASLDRLSGGRFELGLGAGHTSHEYAETGIAMDPPAVRKERLIECLRIIRPLLDGETVDFDGEHVRVRGAAVGRQTQQRLPILVGGNGARLLGAAGELADIVGLQGLGRTLEDGHRHDIKWTADHLTAQIDQVRAGAASARAASARGTSDGAASARATSAGAAASEARAVVGWPRLDEIEFNALVQIVTITDERERVLTEFCEQSDGLTLEDAASIPYLMVGTVDEIVEHIRSCRDRWNITYFVVRELEAFAPILEAFT